MNIILLGSTGYLGKKLLRKLLDDGNNCYVLYINEDKLSDEVFKNKNIHLVNWDIFIQYKDEFFKDIKIDVAYSLIGKYLVKGVTNYDVVNGNFYVPSIFLNFILTRKETKKFISINTALPCDFNVYTKTKNLFSEYGKWAVERERERENFVNLTFANILLESFYGEDEPPDRFIPSVVRKFKNNEDVDTTDGLQKRDYIYIDDVTDILSNLAKIELNDKYIDIPVGTGVGPSIRDMITYLKEITKSSSEIHFGAIPSRKNEPNSVADTTILEKLGLSPKTSWKDGFKILVNKIN